MLQRRRERHVRHHAGADAIFCSQPGWPLQQPHRSQRALPAGMALFLIICYPNTNTNDVKQPSKYSTSELLAFGLLPPHSFRTYSRGWSVILGIA